MATEAQIKANRQNALKAGRPKGSVSEAAKEKLAAQTYITERVVENLGTLIDSAMDEATGIWVEEKNGKRRRIYRRAPNAGVRSDLLNRAVGMPKEDTTIKVEGMEKIRSGIEKILSKKPAAPPVKKRKK